MESRILFTWLEYVHIIVAASTRCIAVRWSSPCVFILFLCWLVESLHFKWITANSSLLILFRQVPSLASFTALRSTSCAVNLFRDSKDYRCWLDVVNTARCYDAGPHIGHNYDYLCWLCVLESTSLSTHQTNECGDFVNNEKTAISIIVLWKFNAAATRAPWDLKNCVTLAKKKYINQRWIPIAWIEMNKFD